MADTIISTGQITLVDLTDERVSSFYLQANQSKIQVYDTNTKTYNPNYESASLNIEPYFFFGNEDYSSKLTATNLSYTINGAAVGQFSGATQNGAKLIISQNINTLNSVAPFNSDTLKIVATIKENGITDEKTGLSNEKIITADIEFAKVSTGLQGVNGIGISEVNQLYRLTEDSTTVPDTPDKGGTGWSEDNPVWDSTKVQYLWICTETIYTDNSKTYSTPYTDNNWKTATEAVKDMENSFGTLREQVGVLQNEVDSAIETWYLSGEPKLLNPPWGDEDNSKHIGDLYYDIVTGYSYRFFKKDDVASYSSFSIYSAELSVKLHLSIKRSPPKTANAPIQSYHLKYLNILNIKSPNYIKYQNLDADKIEKAEKAFLAQKKADDVQNDARNSLYILYDFHLKFFVHYVVYLLLFLDHYFFY